MEMYFKQNKIVTVAILILSSPPPPHFFFLKTFCGYQSIPTFQFKLFLPGYSRPNHIQRSTFCSACSWMWKAPALAHVLIKQGGRGGGGERVRGKGGGGQTTATHKASPVCECVTETDICLTFYAETERLEREWVGEKSVEGWKRRRRSERLDGKHISFFFSLLFFLSLDGLQPLCRKRQY